MYIETLHAWTDVGYAEYSLYVPFKHDLDINTAKWSYENVRPPLANLFSLIRLPVDENRTLELYQNTKYLRIKFSHIAYPVFGWVDGASVLNKKIVGISWHLDIWRTYFHKVKYSGWVRRKPVMAVIEDNSPSPPQTYPAYDTHAGLEFVDMPNQRKGVYWVVLSYIENSQSVTSVFNTVLNAIPGYETAKTIMKSAIEGVKLINSNLIAYSRKGLIMPDREGVITPFYPILPDFDVMRTLSFPISTNAGESLYFQSEKSIDPYSAPTYYEVVNGYLSKTLGISPDCLVSSHITPFCPFNDVGGKNDSGIHETLPLKLSRSSIKELEYSSDDEDEKIWLSHVDDKVFAHIKGHGVYPLGSVLQQDTEYDSVVSALADLLNTYYPFTYKIKPLKFNYKGVDYKIEIKQPSCKHGDWLIAPLAVVLDSVWPSWRRFNTIDISDFVEEDEKGNYHSNIFGIVASEKTGYLGWTGKIKDNKFTLNYKTEELKNLVDLGYSEAQPYKTSKVNRIMVTHNPAYVFNDKDEITNTVHISEVFIGLDDDWDEWPSSLNSVPLPSINTFDVSGIYKIGTFRSLTNIAGSAAIQSSTMTWPVLTFSFPEVYVSDDYRDLVLIDQNGSVLHRFKKGTRIKDFTMQLVTCGTGGYVRLVFDDGSNQFSGVSGNEVHIPTSPMTAVVQYSNPFKYIDQDAQRYVKNRLTDEQISEKRELELKNIELERKREDSGLRSIGADALKEVASVLGQAAVSFNNSTNFLGKVFQGWADKGNAAIGLGKAIGNWLQGKGFHLEEVSDAVQNPTITSEHVEQATTVASSYLDRVNNLTKSKREIRAEEDALLTKQNALEDKYRDYFNSIGGYGFDQTLNVTSYITDLSFVNLLGQIRLVYVTKDDYSVNRFYETSQMLGVDTNEYQKSYRNIEIGPWKIDPCFVSGEDVPTAVLDFIKARLENGVYVDKDL